MKRTSSLPFLPSSMKSYDNSKKYKIKNFLLSYNELKMLCRKNDILFNQAKKKIKYLSPPSTTISGEVSRIRGGDVSSSNHESCSIILSKDDNRGDKTSRVLRGKISKGGHLGKVKNPKIRFTTKESILSPKKEITAKQYCTLLRNQIKAEYLNISNMRYYLDKKEHEDPYSLYNTTKRKRLLSYIDKNYTLYPSV